MSRAESSRRRYRTFVKAYRDRTLEDSADGEKKPKAGVSDEEKARAAGKRREYLRDYIKWLWPHRFKIAGFFLLALITAGLEMIEQLFMRFIIDRVLLNEMLDRATRLSQLHLAGTFFVAVIVVGNLTRVLKDYRQKLLNVQVMLSLRRSLFDRLLHLPLARLWDMKA